MKWLGTVHLGYCGILTPLISMGLPVDVNRFTLRLPETRAGDFIRLNQNGIYKPAVPLGGFLTETKKFQPVFDRENDFGLDNLLINAINVTDIAKAAGKQLGSTRNSFQRYGTWLRNVVDESGKALTQLNGAADGKMNVSMIPKIMPGQKGVLPRLDGELLCNSALDDCESADKIGQAIGEPIRNAIMNSNLYRALDRVYSHAEGVYNVIKAPITDAVIDTLEFEPYVQTLEDMAQSLMSPIHALRPKSNNKYTQALEKAADDMVFDKMRDVLPTPEKVVKFITRMGDLVTCDVFNGCDSEQLRRSGAVEIGNAASENDNHGSVVSRGSEVGHWLRLKDLDTSSIEKFLYVHGFSNSCRRQNSCIVHGRSLFPLLFDGPYELYEVSPGERIVYRRTIHDEFDRREFEEFKETYELHGLETADLYLWFEGNRLHITVGSYGLGVVNLREHAPMPWATLKNIDATNKVIGESCKSDYTDFPNCMYKETTYWALKIVDLIGCEGLKIKNRCVYPINAIAFASSIIDLETENVFNVVGRNSLAESSIKVTETEEMEPQHFTDVRTEESLDIHNEPAK